MTQQHYQKWCPPKTSKRIPSAMTTHHKPSVHSQYAAQTPPYNENTAIGVSGFHKTSRKKFAALVALATFLFTALAFGTGLGIPFAKCRNRFDPNSYAPLPPLQINTAKKNGFCNNAGKLTRNRVFNPRKGFQEGLAAFDPVANTSSTASNGVVRNIAAIVAYDVSDCIHACASLNQMDVNDDIASPRCQSVTFISEMKDNVDLYDGNCFLKNATVAELGQAAMSTAAVSAEVHRLRSEA